MNILFVSGHPAQVHNFRLVRERLVRKGHQVFWLTTKKDIATNLLDTYGIPYELLYKPSKSKLDQLKALLINVPYVMRFLRKNKINIAFSRTCPYTAVAAFLLRVPHIILDDTEHAAQSVFQRPFVCMTNEKYVPSCFWYQMSRKMECFNANIELFYLHPENYTPQAPYNILGIEPNSRYALVRFVKWDAYHDTKLVGGFSLEQKIELVKRLNQHVRVFITSEVELPTELEPYRIQVPIERMHDVQAYADLFIGESSTMASESVVLGTPAIYIDQIGRGYTDEEARAQLLYMYRPYSCQVIPQNNIPECPHPEVPIVPFKDADGNEPWWVRGGIEEAIAQAEYIVSPAFDRAAWQQRHQAWLKNKINPTKWLVDYISHYPQSAHSAKTANEDFWEKFK